MNNQNGIKGMRMLQQLVIAAAMVLASVASHAQTTIDAVTGSTSGGTEVVRIDLSQPLTAVPTGFSIQSPARIALDFPGISNGMGRSTIDINQGNLKSVSVVHAGGTRRGAARRAPLHRNQRLHQPHQAAPEPAGGAGRIRQLYACCRSRSLCICGKQEPGYAATEGS